jgi:VanZ family protein
MNARLLLTASIALIVAVADEIHQAYVPGRDASITDVLLDLFGIILVLFFVFRLFKTKANHLRINLKL